MKKMISGLVLFMAFASLTSTGETAAPKTDETIYIEAGKVGEISTGMDLTDLMKKYPSRFEKTSVFREGDEMPAFIYTFNNKKTVMLEVTDANVVLAIRVEDPSFKTRKGVGAGNTFKEVKSAYPDAEFYAGLEEGESIALTVKGFAFLFETHRVNIDWFLQSKKDMNAIQNIKVETVRVAH